MNNVFSMFNYFYLIKMNPKGDSRTTALTKDIIYGLLA